MEQDMAGLRQRALTAHPAQVDTRLRNLEDFQSHSTNEVQTVVNLCQTLHQQISGAFGSAGGAGGGAGVGAAAQSAGSIGASGGVAEALRKLLVVLGFLRADECAVVPPADLPQALIHAMEKRWFKVQAATAAPTVLDLLFRKSEESVVRQVQQSVERLATVVVSADASAAASPAAALPESSAAELEKRG